MARNFNLLQLDVDKLFEEHKIDEIIEIEKLLDAEIERKRIDLRSMVGARYKDVLAASDAIKNMKDISQGIVDNIDNITSVCERLILDTPAEQKLVPCIDEKKCSDERMLIIQVRLAIFLNEQIWISLDKGDNLTASQFYLLAQHIHMGLSISNVKQLNRITLLQPVKSNLQILREQIFSRINQKLESVEITAEECSSNLNAFLLLQNQSTSALFNILVEHRKIALNCVMNSTHSSVRVQISAMVRCLITTVHLLHDCFISYGNSRKGLIWEQLEDIVQDSSTPTLSRLELPITPLNSYIPDIIKQFRPKYKSTINEPLQGSIALEDWLKSTKMSVENGLQNSLELVTNVKGLHIIREEALKIEIPSDWAVICSETNLPNDFNVWYHFFQHLITQRALCLVSEKVTNILTDTVKDLESSLNNGPQNEVDLRLHAWVEQPDDISHPTKNQQTGLQMKTLGFSHNIATLCQNLDKRFLNLLVDISLYLCGKEFDADNPQMYLIQDHKSLGKFLDKENLENHLRIESTKKLNLLVNFLQEFVDKSAGKPDLFVTKSLKCARFLHATTTLCSHFKKCCTFNGIDDWSQICTNFTKCSLQFWENWVDICTSKTVEKADQQLSDHSMNAMLSMLAKWDTIEIQEQTDEKVFKSHIKVPFKPSLTLHNLLNKLNDDMSSILPHTLPKQIHLSYIEKNVAIIFEQYNKILKREDVALNQNQALQFLFDVKFLTTFCVPRDNSNLITTSQEICDTLRSKIDPFDLDVFYSYLQGNVKRAVMQSQMILGCLLPCSTQLANIDVSDNKSYQQDKEPTIIALSTPSVNSWFPLLPISVPSQKSTSSSNQSKAPSSPKAAKTTPKKQTNDPTAAMRSSAAALFGGLTTDWFS